VSNPKNGWRPLSLAQHFDAPDGYRGEFGWICGFSADASFLNDAAERFTRLTQGQRAQEGRVVLALYLDPSNPQIRFPDAPGVAHLPIQATGSRDFRLLHAKIALLAFRHGTDRQQWMLRLIVSTGNWTRQTLEDSLDVAWRIDIPSEALQRMEGLSEACADIRAAWDLFEWLAARFDTRLLEAGGRSGLADPHEMARTWIQACIRKARGTARLFDNRKRPLFEEIKARLVAQERVVARKYLAMGSGFFESAANGEASIPQRIVRELVDLKLLTKSGEVDLFVNPLACQSIATSMRKLLSASPAIVVRPASTPQPAFHEASTRGLHAKFLFSANWREGSNACSSPWVYLGSGNLTTAGFLLSAGKSSGNLEAGVLLYPEGVEWRAGRSVDADRVVTNLLPIQWDEQCAPEEGLQSGPEWSLPDAEFVASPVPYFEWHEEPTGGELRPVGGNCADLVVWRPEGERCELSATGFLWPEPMPRAVRVTWDGGHREADIPVVDQYGRIASTLLPSIGLDEAWWQLADFPTPPESDAQEEGVDREVDLGAGATSNGPHTTRSTPIRQMMQLIENIASRQTSIVLADWSLWCARLEQTLCQAKESAPVKAFVTLRLNPLSPLHAVPFRPHYAESGTSEAGKIYEQALARVEAAWEVAGLARLGGQL
jgi:hypothetical protein